MRQKKLVLWVIVMSHETIHGCREMSSWQDSTANPPTLVMNETWVVQLCCSWLSFGKVTLQLGQFKKKRGGRGIHKYINTN